MTNHGRPCWFEYSAKAGELEKAKQFYASVLGWQIESFEMGDFTYSVAFDDKGKIAGIIEAFADAAPNWLTYFEVGNVDQTAAQAQQNGATLVQEPEDIPDSGRYSILKDPKGAAFGLMQMEPMPPDEPFVPAFAPASHGRPAWVELMADQPSLEFDFYAKLFPFKKTTRMDIPDMADGYQIFSQGDEEIGAMQGQGSAPVPNWQVYFWVSDLGMAMDQVKANGGKIVHGPGDIPGNRQIAICLDPWMANFALVGNKVSG